MSVDDNKQFWGRCAKMYGPIQQRTNQRLYAEVEQACIPFITKDLKVLEIACGSGQLTKPLCDRAGYWEATDFSPRMVEQTRKVCPQVATAVEDVTCLSYQDKSFDLVIIANALHIMPDPYKAMEEVSRVLVDQGLVIAPTFVYEGKVNRVRMALTNAVGFRTYREWNMADLVSFLQQAGFVIIDQKLIKGSPLPEGFVVAKKV